MFCNPATEKLQCLVHKLQCVLHTYYTKLQIIPHKYHNTKIHFSMIIAINCHVKYFLGYESKLHVKHVQR